MTQMIKIVYIDDLIDNYISNYLFNYKKKDIDCLYEEYEIKNTDSYESLIRKNIVESADILIIDSMLFENENVGTKKLSGEDLKLILKKLNPFKEIIVVTQHKEKEDFSNLSKYSRSKYKGMGPKEFFYKKWESILNDSIDKIILNRRILNKIEKDKNLDKYLIEKLNNSMHGINDYNELRKEDIDKLIKSFEEMRKSYEK